MRVRIVVPAHDEAATVGAVVEGARRWAPVIVVDDGSTDRTAAEAAAAGAEVVRHRRRLGKGPALRTGFAAARARGATHVVTLDADGQHDPADVPTLLAAAGPRTIVVGAREPSASAGARAHANRVAGFFVHWASGLRLPDTQCGFRLYPVAVLDEVPTRRGGFVFETEVLLAAAERGFGVRWVPVRARARAVARSRFRPLGDGAAVAAYLGRRVLARWAAAIAAGLRGERPGARGPRLTWAAAAPALALPLALPALLVADLGGFALPGPAARWLAALYDPARLETGARGRAAPRPDAREARA